jgi:hypothetical protein
MMDRTCKAKSKRFNKLVGYNSSFENALHLSGQEYIT